MEKPEINLFCGYVYTLFYGKTGLPCFVLFGAGKLLQGRAKDRLPQGESGRAAIKAPFYPNDANSCISTGAAAEQATPLTTAITAAVSPVYRRSSERVVSSLVAAAGAMAA